MLMTMSLHARCVAVRRTLLATACLGLAVQVSAEPLQLVDLLDENDLAGGLDGIISARPVGEDRLVALVLLPNTVPGEGQRRELVLFARDPDTGGLGVLDRSGGIGERTQPGFRELYASGMAVHGNTVWASGRASPSTCSASPCDNDQVVFAYTIGDDGLTFAYQSERGFDADDLVVSDDGRFLRRFGPQSVYTLRVQEIGNLVQTARNIYAEQSSRMTPRHHDALVSHDGRYVFVTLRDDPAIVVLSSDAETGALDFVQRIDAGDTIPLDERGELALSPDDRVLYVTTDDDATPGVMRFDVATNGTLSYAGIDESANLVAPGTAERPIDIALSDDGRQMFVHDYARYIHKYTADDAGRFTYRGFETNDEDGVPGTTIRPNLGDNGSLLITGDAAFVQYYNRVGGIATFDDRADLAVGFDDGVTAASDGSLVTRRLVLTNLGPATAHGIRLDIDSDTAFASSSSPGICAIEGSTTMRCSIDRLRPNTSFEITMSTTSDADGFSALEAGAAAIEIDPDTADNASFSSARLDPNGGGVESTVEGSGVPASTVIPVATGPASDTGGGASGDSGGGGCSITGSTRGDPLLALLCGAAVFGVVRRRRPVRTWPMARAR